MVDMRQSFFELVLNAMMRMIAGKRYYGETDADSEEAKRFREIQVETFTLSNTPNLGDFIPIMKWIGPKRTEKRLTELHMKRDGFMQNLIEEHRKTLAIDDSSETQGRKKNMIEVLLSLQKTEPEYYKDEMIRALMLVLLLAGTDSSVNTMEWALSLLLNHPKALQKAQAEIDNIMGQNRLINESYLAHLPYIRGIISETLRMYPPGPLLMPHESSQDCTVGGYWVPGGTMLFVNLWAMQNDPKTWVDPGEFKPERFGSCEGMRDGFRFMPFGTGRRGCPGEGLAMSIVGLALGSLIQCFEWEKIGEEMVDMKERSGLNFTKDQPLYAKCRLRPSMVKVISEI
ncbi:hypothetical protein GH714_012161 [Hevea brasiliensis]|uniref:Cytochrome P450 n=1 Tax=Hevea brasiliensis TaxID=3981 RepID=A0A6A6NGP8_HEVBR|nr:hypothetical protein GH714_012161 [Hevea brasiliensis]